MAETADELQELEAVFDRAGDGLCIADGSGLILSVNRAFIQLTGYERHQVEGQRAADLTEQGRFSQSAVMAALRHRQSVAMVSAIPSGREFLVSATPVWRGSELWRVVATVQDVTELVRLQEELAMERHLVTSYDTQREQPLGWNGRGPIIVAQSASMKQVVHEALRAAVADASVSISGASGVGKELVAELIHCRSGRSARSFIKVNCAAIPDSLMEAEFFGYDAGSFTGARAGGKPGYFELADGGTLLLDEVGDLPLALQAKLLRVLQDYEVLRVGGTTPRKVDVRVIAATSRDLPDQVERGQFRLDLYHRLSVIPIFIPPLQDRPDDIPLLVDHYLRRYNLKYMLAVTLSPEVKCVLQRYVWPGNVRELSNLLERLVAMSAGRAVTVDDLPAELMNGLSVRGHADDNPADVLQTANLREAVEGFEAQMIMGALERTASIREAARTLGLSHVTLLRKMRQYRLSV